MPEPTIRLIARGLAFAGLIPFLVSAWGATRYVPLTAAGISADFFLASYGAVILAFLGGIHWGLVIAGGSGTGAGLLLASNLAALLAWAALLLAPGNIAIALVMLTLGFMAVLLVDRRLAAVGLLQPWYLGLRAAITMVVLACLAAPLVMMARSL